MISLTLLAVAISSGSVFSAVFFGRKYEEALPVTLFSLVLTVYTFGIFGFLKAGVWLFLAACRALYIFSAIKFLKDKKYLDTLGNIFTPARVVFWAFMVFYVRCIVGRVPYLWDEFSHWRTSVKIMFYTGGLYSARGSGAQFPTYPPAMAIFQYFVMFLNGEFVDWRLNFAYCFFALAIMMYFLRHVDFKNIFKAAVAVALLLCVMFNFSGEVFYSLYIDCFLGLLTGFLFAVIAAGDIAGDSFDRLVFVLGVAVLTLTKDAGSYFAVMLCVIYMAVYIFRSRPGDSLKDIRPQGIKTCVNLALPLVAFAAAKLSWSAHLRANQRTSRLLSSYDIPQFFGMLAGVTDFEYGRTILSKFISVITSPPLGYEGVRPAYLVVIISELLFLAALLLLSKKDRREDKNKRLIVTIGIFATNVIYLLALVMTYIYKFSQYEAMVLASFDRYILYVIIPPVVVISAFIIRYTDRDKAFNRLICLAAAALLAFGTLNSESWPLLRHRYYANYSRDFTARFMPLIYRAEDLNLSDSDICFISQRDTGFDYQLFSYYLYPNKVTVVGSYSITDKEGGLYDGDIWTKTVSAERFLEGVRECDYLMIYKADQRFIDEYGQRFESPEDIHGDGLYTVSGSGLLQLVP